AAQQGQVWRMADAGVRPALARRLVDRFAHVGIALRQNDISELVNVLTCHRRQVLVQRWIGWVGQFSAKTITPRLARLLASAGRDLVLPAIGEERLHDCLCRWLDPPHCQIAIDASVRGPLVQWLRRTGAYQALAGQAAVTPPSVQKVLRRGEPTEAEGTSSRAVRAAQEALLTIAISALRTLLGRRCADLWRAEAGCEPPVVPLARALNLVRWIGKLDQSQRQMLREVGSAWNRYGGAYKFQLPQNQAWIARLTASGRDPSAWMQSRGELATLAGQSVSVSIARDPREILMMGEYFATCLSIGQSNEMSVLANAYDANKQVVFVVGKSPAGRRQVVARQLIAVSGDFQLLGYRCYMAIDKQRKDDREACLALVAAFCGRLARRCGLTLAKDGEPEEIGSHFWYDDGTFAWHAAAHQASNVDDGGHQAASHALPLLTGEACTAPFNGGLLV
ncbi:MAG TPA: hypothetical protein VFB96_11085, partial [Pirellulaceae bacterium]|nr:hypothetical protein [Pirellulaceae bacterium]